MAFAVNHQELCPMHMAVENNECGIVMELLSNETQNSCFQRDREGRNPVHYMAMRGYEDMLFAVLRTCPESAKILTDRGENILHVCLKYSHEEMMMKLITEFDFVRKLIQQRDYDGKSVFELADSSLGPEMLKELRGVAEKEKGGSGWDGGKELKDALKSTKDGIAVVAALVAAATFAVGLNPPGGAYHDGPKFIAFEVLNILALCISINVLINAIGFIPHIKADTKQISLMSKELGFSICFMLSAFFLGQDLLHLTIKDTLLPVRWTLFSIMAFVILLLWTPDTMLPQTVLKNKDNSSSLSPAMVALCMCAVCCFMMCGKSGTGGASKKPNQQEEAATRSGQSKQGQDSGPALGSTQVGFGSGSDLNPKVSDEV
ncbi:uncharacterized protein LOC18426733 [Amborella trichopoda]|nr:uncharacterized protein LOC18426733 [Amborella trichopoda]|eukprot:XP_006833438.2 uncharacterized protein LOC18426733 [Amborella trichopoda]